jgi:hypothetical protein
MRRSTTLMRSWSVSSVSSFSTAHGVLVDDRARVDARIDEVTRRAGHGDAVGERVAHRMRAGEGGQQGRVGVDDRVLPEGHWAEQLHKACRDDEGGRMGRDVLRESGVPVRARREVRDAANKGGYAGRLRPRLPESSGAIGSDSRDPDAIAEIGAGVDERLEQRARSPRRGRRWAAAA